MRLLSALMIGFVLAALAVAHAAQRAIPLKGDPCDGTWKVSVEPDSDASGAGKKPFDDTLTFKYPSFESAALKKHGFPSASFDDNPRPGGVAAFKVKQTSTTEGGTAEWQGNVTATSIDGSLIWTAKDGTVDRYNLSGNKTN